MKVLKLVLLFLLINSPIFAAAQGPPPAKIVTAPLTQSEIAQNEPFTGTLYYDRVSNISSETAGLVAEVKVKAGDSVSQGSPLLHLNTDILDREIAILKNKLAQNTLTSRHTEKNFKRLETLYAQKGISEKSYDDALFAWQTAQLDQKSLQIELEKLLLQKEKSIIYAPFAGIVLEKDIDQGDWVQPGKQLFRLGAVEDLMIKVPVREELLRFIGIGQEVPVTLNAFERELHGKIADFIPIADPTTKSIYLKISIPPLSRVAVNMSATVFIPNSEKHTLCLIPRDALIKFQGKDFVYTVKEGKAAIMPVHIVTYLHEGVAAADPYFVPGFPVVIEGNERLRPDQPVIVTNAGAH